MRDTQALAPPVAQAHMDGQRARSLRGNFQALSMKVGSGKPIWRAYLIAWRTPLPSESIATEQNTPRKAQPAESLRPGLWVYMLRLPPSKEQGMSSFCQACREEISPGTSVKFEK